MIAEVFLIGALALRGGFYQGSMEDEDRIRSENVRRIHDYVEQHYPGSELWIGETAPTMEYERTPLLWNNKPIWIKRPPVWDRRSS